MNLKNVYTRKDAILKIIFNYSSDYKQCLRNMPKSKFIAGKKCTEFIFNEYVDGSCMRGILSLIGNRLFLCNICGSYNRLRLQFALVLFRIVSLVSFLLNFFQDFFLLSLPMLVTGNKTRKLFSVHL